MRTILTLAPNAGYPRAPAIEPRVDRNTKKNDEETEHGSPGSLQKLRNGQDGGENHKRGRKERVAPDLQRTRGIRLLDPQPDETGHRNHVEAPLGEHEQ